MGVNHMNRYELKATRQAFNLTQEAMAEHIGLSWRQYQRLEAGDNAISESLAKLIRLLFHLPT